MLTFLFWNMKESPRIDVLERLVERHRVDVVMLAECALGRGEVLERFNALDSPAFHYNPGNCERITVYSRFGQRQVRPLVENHHMSVRRLKLPAGDDLLLAVVHLQSKLYQSESSQMMAAAEIARMITTAEKKAGHRRTLLVGDLNMHPFEHGVVGAGGLHATMDRRIAMQGQRTIHEKPYVFLYNPMWSLLGDASRGPPGTYYQRRNEHVAYFWHMFDQVLIRPDLLSMFDNEDLLILDHDGTTSFLTPSGTPDETVASDHLPILFRLRC
jgi:hypothetical protein